MMMAEAEMPARFGPYPQSDARYRSTKAIAFWEVVRTTHFASGAMQLRIKATYLNGGVRMIGAGFADRTALNNYLDRWWPTFAGKEKSS
jgi:hypothetical protein